ncbi:hypothetical protein PENSOL_c413G11432, partial [Penicillium solitum]
LTSYGKPEGGSGIPIRDRASSPVPGTNKCTQEARQQARASSKPLL